MSIDLRRLVAVSAVLAVISTPSAAEYGRTMGAFNVSGGAATYTIPIWTPPGPNGMTPSIALTYSSASGNGVGGVGWHLSAVSSIERCNRNAHQDGGGGGPVTLTMNDRFCIGGNRLRAVSGTYGAAGSVYHTEMADYSRITAYGTTGNGPQYFVVEAKSGLKYEYGATTTSRVVLAGTAMRWMLNRVYDRSGNNYVISYNSSSGFAVPDVISWTPTALNSSSYRYEAKFNYYTSRTDEDSYLGRVAGNDVVNRFRLESVQIKSSGAVIRKYRFAYDTSPATSRSRLTSAKECADDAESNCLLPITFAYQAGVTGVSGTPISGIGSSSSLALGKYDFDGDGRSDLLFVSGSTWHVSLSTGSGFGAAINTGVSSSATFHVQRFLANNQDGLLVSVGGVWTYFGYNGNGAFYSEATATAVSSSTIVTDNNGDRLADLVWTSGGSVLLRLNITAAGATKPSFTSSPITAATFNVGQGNVAITNAQHCPFDRMCDINGDGRADLLVNVVTVPTGCGIGGCTPVNTKYDLYATGNGYGVGPQVGAIGYRGMHFNDDRCIDRIPNAAPTTLEVSNCSGTFTTISLPASGGILMDWNGDGNTDIVVNNGGFFGVYLSKGNPGSPFSSLIPTSIPRSSSCNYFVFDADGDGLDDLGCVGTSSPFAVSFYPRNGGGGVYLTQEPDLLSSATDGFGVNVTPSYVSTSQNNYTRGTGTQLPLVDVTEPMTVVAQVTQSNGIGGTFTSTYSYHGARRNAPRGEFVGFQRIDVIDSRNNVIGRTYFEQTFPVSGMVSQQETMQPNGVTPIARLVFTNSFTSIDTTPYNQRYFVYPQASTATQYEVGGTWNGNLLRTVATSNSFHLDSGTLYDQTVTTSEPASGANGVSAGASWTVRTHSPTANFSHDNANWCLGRPGRTERTNSHNLTYGAAITRTTTIAWNTTLCRPTSTVEEPGSATLEVTTSIGYDGFGNVNSTSVTGIGMPARTTSMTYSDTTFTTGQFPLTVTNALGQTSSSAWNYNLGVPTSATDPNGLITSWEYDAFGRRNREVRPDNTATTWSINNCTAISGGCVGANNKTVIAETALNSSSAYVNDALTYLDAFDRPIITTTRLVTGAYNRVDREYDALGRVYRESAPCLWSSCSTHWVTHSYDLANRPTQVSRPISDANSTLQYSYAHYEGLTTRHVDAQNKQTVKIVNAAGQLVRSTDHNGYYQTFEYDAFGGIRRLRDSNTYELQTSNYNLRGMLTARTDMDMGSWSFTPNALGEVVSQTDAKGQTTTFGFDLLGRLTSRTEAEGTSTWTWGTPAHNTASNKYIGGLKSVSGPGYSETYTNDALGRPSATTISADTTYQIDYTYNNIGALDTLTYPTSTSSYRLKLQHDYHYGQLYRVRDFNALTTHFWTANAANPRNQLTQETLANGLVTNRSYDAVTGWLKSIQTGLSGGTGIQNLAYQWDLAGNLKERKDVNQSNLTEAFFYDDLYRLDYSTLNGITNLDMAYDALGNITSKSDVGTYTYHAAKKHQVTSTSNGWSFGYDPNGNMTSGRGATITWTSFNYPASITSGTNTASFSYTPDRQYWRLVSNYASGGSATTIYVGGLLEKVTTSAGTDFRHMIRAGGSTIIVSRQSTGTNSVHYVTRDHLGSGSAVTNSSGGILVNSSFDAFGKRRGANWSGSPSSGDWAAIAGTTRRGYTDHTMLDNLGLIHMNGRVQDPVLGRFASADPNIPGLGTQHFNRYSYVTNNPLSYSDPSGFVPWQNGPEGSYDYADEEFGAPVGTEDNPIITVGGSSVGWGRWIDEGASSPAEDGRRGPCESQFGGTYTAGGCQAITSQTVGWAIAGAMTELNREGPQQADRGETYPQESEECWNGEQGTLLDRLEGLLRELGNEVWDLAMIATHSATLGTSTELIGVRPLGRNNTNNGLLGHNLAPGVVIAATGTAAALARYAGLRSGTQGAREFLGLVGNRSVQMDHAFFQAANGGPNTYWNLVPTSATLNRLMGQANNWTLSNLKILQGALARYMRNGQLGAVAATGGVVGTEAAAAVRAHVGCN
jgi:RHS repeat-associated protein